MMQDGFFEQDGESGTKTSLGNGLVLEITQEYSPHIVLYRGKIKDIHFYFMEYLP